MGERRPRLTIVSRRPLLAVDTLLFPFPIAAARRKSTSMIQFNGVNLPVDFVTGVYFNDHRIRRMLKSMRNVNSGVALPSLLLLIPVSHTRPSDSSVRRYMFDTLFSIHKRYSPASEILREITFCFSAWLCFQPFACAKPRQLWLDQPKNPDPFLCTITVHIYKNQHFF